MRIAAVGETRLGLGHRQAGGELADAGAALGLGEDDKRRGRSGDGGDVGVDHPGIQGVDADRGARRRDGAGGDGALARGGLAGGGDAVLEVEDDDVGLGGERLLDLALLVRRDEQPGTHQAARFFIIAIRLVTATTTSSWLKPVCSNSTRPTSGRDFDSRFESTFVSA